MTCGEWEERIAAEMEDAAGHVAECGACREFASGLRWALSEAASAHGEEIAPAHYAAVRARVLAELRARRRWGWAWAAVGVCAVVMGVAVRDRMGGRTGDRSEGPGGCTSACLRARFREETEQGGGDCGEDRESGCGDLLDRGSERRRVR